MFVIAFNDINTMEKVKQLLKNMNLDNRIVMTGSPYEAVSRLEAEATFNNIIDDLKELSKEEENEFMKRLTCSIYEDEDPFDELSENAYYEAIRIAKEMGLYA